MPIPFIPPKGDVALIAVLKEVEFLPDGRCLLEVTTVHYYYAVQPLYTINTNIIIQL